MPELPEGTINAFIQNKNLAKYGLLKDNEGGFLAENFVVQYAVSFLLPYCFVAVSRAPSTRRRRAGGVGRLASNSRRRCHTGLPVNR